MLNNKGETFLMLISAFTIKQLPGFMNGGSGLFSLSFLIFQRFFLSNIEVSRFAIGYHGYLQVIINI